MIRPLPRKDLSLKALELFQVCAQKGSLQAAAAETGLSISTISHHLRGLEAHLGAPLFDHARRPMVLTPRGQAFLRNIEEALLAIRRATAEASAGDLAEASYLRIGSIEDLDSDIAPELAVHLSAQMPRCDFTYRTDVSQAIIDMLRDRRLDLGVAAGSFERSADLNERPLLNDPFVIAAPRGAGFDAKAALSGRTDLPLLRFSSDLLIAKRIETQLRRIGASGPRRFECSNNQTLMAMVAAGAGWTITTPLLFARARRFHERTEMHPFPGKRFARALSILSTPDCAGSVVEAVEGKLRELLVEHAVAPIHANAPWLKGLFELID